MKRASLLMVGVALACVVCVTVVAFIMGNLGMLGFCGAPTFCQNGSFCVCPEYYAPVLGLPSFRVYSNACFACADGAWLWIRI